MERRLQGRVAIVTGAGSGIGAGIALRLAREGAAVVAADINADAAAGMARRLAALGVPSLAVVLDIAKPDETKALVDRTASELGPIGILVNCAGVVQNKPFLEVTEADWDRIIDVNQKGTAFAIQAVAAHMVARVPDEVKKAGRADRSYGKILSITSISGRRGRDYQLAYAASKAAIISITQSSALAFARFGINVNAIAPSVVVTPLWEQCNREKEAAFGIDARKVHEDFVARIPLKRAGTVEDVAAAAAFLCSADADYITGQTLNVDGGFEMN